MTEPKSAPATAKFHLPDYAEQAEKLLAEMEANLGPPDENSIRLHKLLLEMAPARGDDASLDAWVAELHRHIAEVRAGLADAHWQMQHG